MKTVWKYEIFIGENIIPMPKNSQVLSTNIDNEKFFIWVLVDSDRQPGNITVYLYPTGYEISNNPGRFIGTIKDVGSTMTFFWHVFQKEDNAFAGFRGGI